MKITRQAKALNSLQKLHSTAPIGAVIRSPDLPLKKVPFQPFIALGMQNFGSIALRLFNILRKARVTLFGILSAR
jgi:hypothetical protein